MHTNEIEKQSVLRLLNAVADGVVADYTIGESNNDPEHGECWGDNRKLSASLVREVCLGKHKQAPLEARGINIKGARIVGELDLSWTELRIPLKFEKCYFDSPIKLIQARTKTIEFTGSFMRYGLDGGGLHADGDIHIQNVVSRGAIEFPGSRVDGRMNFNGANIYAPKINKKSNGIQKIMTNEEWQYKKGMAIALSQAKIENGLFFRKSDKDFICNDYIEMRGMTLRGNLEIEGSLNQFPEAQRENFALDMEGATVSGTIFSVAYR